MTREEKNQFIDALDSMLKDNQNFYLADISGLTAEESSSLRRLCFRRDVSLKMVKNTLLKKALERNDTDFEELYDVLKGNTSIMFSETGSGVAKAIKEFRKKHEKPVLKAAHIEDEFYIGDENLAALAALKSKDELIAELMVLLQSPIKNLLSSLQSANTKLSGVIKSLQDQSLKNNTEEPATEETPAEEPATEETPAEEPATEETPAEEPATEETPAEEEENNNQD